MFSQVCGSSTTCCDGQCAGNQCCGSGTTPCGTTTTTCCSSSEACINEVCAPVGSIACGPPGVAPGYCTSDSTCTGPENNICCPAGFTVCTAGVIGGLNTEYDEQTTAANAGGSGVYGQYGAGIAGNPCCGGQCNPQSGVCCPPSTLPCGAVCCDQTHFCTNANICCRVGSEQGCGTR